MGKIKSIKKAYEESLVVDDSKDVIKTNTKLDLAIGGIQPNKIYTIGGLPGCGKSSLVNFIETEISKEASVLNFSLEMMGREQVERKRKRIAAMKLTAEERVRHLEELVERDISYVEESLSPQEIFDLAEKYIEGAKRDKIVILIDHLLLVKGRDDKKTIDELQKLLVGLKKMRKVSIIQLAQLNRDILSMERLKNPQFHYPIKNDISTTDSIFQSSDIVIIVHRPEEHGIMVYGPQGLDARDAIFLHVLKYRNGVNSVVKVENRLETQDWSNK